MHFSLLITLAMGAVFQLNDADPQNDKIKQIVVLMLENRSFDSYLGRLKADGMNMDVNGPDLVNGTDPINTLPDGSPIYPRRVGTELQDAKFDPGHEVPDVTEQLYGVYNGNVRGTTASMTGFARNIYRNAQVEKTNLNESMNAVFALHGPQSIPVTYALAQEYGVIDDWYASVPGPTYTNRHFLHCATALGQTSNLVHFVFGKSGFNGFKGLPCNTIYNNLNSKKISWKVYTDSILSSVTMYSDFRHWKNLWKINKFSNFKKDAKKGKLPQFSYIDPNFLENDNHPGHDIGNGEVFLKDVYETLRASPQWESTLLIVTYDEHGGHYDHVKPPINIPIPDDSKVTPPSGDFAFDRLGVRVPAMLISPWIPKGSVFRSGVDGRYIEHSSVSATLKRKFNLDNYLTKRDAWAVSLHSATNYLNEPRKDCSQKLNVQIPNHD